jgi:aspartate kinase
MLDCTLTRDTKAIEQKIREMTDFHKKIIENAVQGDPIKKELLQFIDKEITSLFNFLLALVEIHEVTIRSRDRVISLGEILSARILEGVLNSLSEKKARFLNLDRLIPNNGQSDNDDDKFFLNAEKSLGKLLAKEAKKFPILVLTGFIGKIPGGIVETIGRGYTDFTASLAASGTNARQLEIWKEVDGIFSADPRKMPKAYTLTQISYLEAAELTFFGTEAIHPRTMEPCIRKQIPILVKNVLNPQGKGTIVNSEKRPSQTGIGKALTQKSNIFIINIESNKMNEAPGFIYRMGEIFYRHKVSIDLMATSEVSVSITVHDIDKEKLKNLKKELTKIGDVSIMDNLAAISIIGHGMQHKIGAAGAIFSTMGKNSINIVLISQGASELSISFVVKKEDADRAIRILHEEILNK